MTMAENADLISLGKHCFVEHCKQLDFLPFKCSFCQETFWYVMISIYFRPLDLEISEISSISLQLLVD